MCIRDRRNPCLLGQPKPVYDSGGQRSFACAPARRPAPSEGAAGARVGAVGEQCDQADDGGAREQAQEEQVDLPRLPVVRRRARLRRGR
eukprot:338640-Alexandrium_andersonii.AAC.1